MHLYGNLFEKTETIQPLYFCFILLRTNTSFQQYVTE